jgi:hypothetical protein
LHPVLEGSGEFTFGMTPNMLITVIVCISAVILLYIYLLYQRTKLGELEEDVAALREQYAE